MPMLDIQSIKSQINADNIIDLMDSLGADYNFASSHEIHFRSICHGSDSYKLYWYDDGSGGRLHCHRDGETWDVIGFVEFIKHLDFIPAVEYICQTLSINANEVSERSDVDPWQKDLRRWLPNADVEPEPLTTYDPSVLRLFKPLPHKSWLDDGISASTMSKFGIGWYGRNAQVAIPVHDPDGNLVGIHARNTRRAVIDAGRKYEPLRTLTQDYRFPTGRVCYGLYENQAAIKSSHEIVLFEAPKSTLQMVTMLGDSASCVSLFGWNCNKLRRDMLLDLGIQRVNIALDRQYHKPSGDEFAVYVRQVKKIAALFKPYCQVGIIWDKQDRLGYKDSPSDKGLEVWNQLYQERTIL